MYKWCNSKFLKTLNYTHFTMNDTYLVCLNLLYFDFLDVVSGFKIWFFFFKSRPITNLIGCEAYEYGHSHYDEWIKRLHYTDTLSLCRYPLPKTRTHKRELCQSAPIRNYMCIIYTSTLTACTFTLFMDLQIASVISGTRPMTRRPAFIFN